MPELHSNMFTMMKMVNKSTNLLRIEVENLGCISTSDRNKATWVHFPCLLKS